MIELLTRAGQGFIGGFTACRLARDYDVQVQVTGTHVHHDLAGIGLMAVGAGLGGLKLLDKTIAALIFGAGAAVTIDHLLFEPKGCTDGVCLHSIMKSINKNNGKKQMEVKTNETTNANNSGRNIGGVGSI